MKITISNVNEYGATVSVGDRPGVPLSWQTMRDAARQSDPALAHAYSEVLAAARAAATHLTESRWETSTHCGVLGYTSEHHLGRLVLLAVADGVPEEEVRRSARLVRLDPDEVAECRRRGGHLETRYSVPAWARESVAFRP
ncbi:MAG: hypothetical protein ACRCSL_16575 [Microbacterium sp.]